MTTTTRILRKTVRIGTTDGVSVFCKIEFRDGKLSISGVEGPMSNGDAKGACGQIIMGFREYGQRGHKSLEDIAPAAGWTHESIREFFDIWDRWHLNDMRAGCDHQRDWDTTEKVEVVTYKLTSEALQIKRGAKRKAQEAAADSVVADLDERERALLKSSYNTKRPPDADSPLSGCYEVAEREQKAVGWLHPEEHPSGLLGKPCDVCGYRYGTEWKREEVPVDVLDALEAFPDADRTPAWV